MKDFNQTTITNKHEKNDCVVRAIATSFGIEYKRSHQICENLFNRKRRDGTQGLPAKLSNPNIVSQLESMGYSFKPYTVNYTRKWDNGIQKMNIRRFCRTYSQGTFLVLVSKHALTIKDGEVIDWDNFKPKLQRKVLHAWKVENQRQLKFSF